MLKVYLGGSIMEMPLDGVKKYNKQFVGGISGAFNQSKFLKSKASGYRETFELPTAAKNKNRNISWMHYWPFSAAWTLVNNPIKRAFRLVYFKVESTFNKISSSVFSDIIEEQKNKKK